MTNARCHTLKGRGFFLPDGTLDEAGTGAFKMPILSISFIVLLVCTFFIYYLIPERHRWIVLLAASMTFYLFSGPRNLIYLLITSITVYLGAFRIQMITEDQKRAFKEHFYNKEEKGRIRKKNKKRKKACLFLVLAINLSFLLFFKYAHFALSQFNGLMAILGREKVPDALSFIVPLGISFYTFQAIGYLVDVYGEVVKVERNYFRLLLFISFFPQVTQGPISSYAFLSQTLYAGKTPDESAPVRGFQRIVWGFLKKMVIANSLAQNTSLLFEHYPGYSGISILLGTFLYLIQLYADFSGYMDIMCGYCEMLGITLTENFNRPFFSKSISEYWRRWHISLGQWFRQYVYYPIGVSAWNLKLGKALKKYSKHAANCLPPTIALLVTWFCTGLWHGASWGYIVWGLFNGLFLILSLWLAPLYERMRSIFHIRVENKLWRLFCVLRTFTIAAMLEVLPEVGSLTDGFHLWRCIFTNAWIPHSLGALIPFVHLRNFNRLLGFSVAMLFILVMFIGSLMQRKKPIREYVNALPNWCQILGLSLMILVILTFGIQASWGAEGFMYANF